MNSADYWKKRFLTLEDEIGRKTYKSAARLDKPYNDAIHEMQTEIGAWYGRLAENNGISLSDAYKLLSKDELEEFHWSVEKYIERGEKFGEDGSFLKELENASARVHISRLESAKTLLRAHAGELAGVNLQAVTEASRTSYEESYYRSAFELEKAAGVGLPIKGIDNAQLEKILAKPWAADGRTFSARIWSNRNALIETLSNTLTRSVALGEDPGKVIKALTEQFLVDKRRAARLVYTESAFFSAAARKDCYDELGVDRYKVVASLDEVTCPICGELDGKVFDRKDYMPGATANPFHPNCRCTTAPFIEDFDSLGERFSRDVETGEAEMVPADMTYEKWREEQDKKYGENTVDKRRKMVYNESADRKQYKQFKTDLEEVAPDTFVEFQRIKYDDPEKWKSLKAKSRIINSYKVDSGSISKSELLRLDDVVISEKREKFTSKFKRSGNIAGAYIDGDKSNMFFAHSMMNNSSKGYKGIGTLVTLKENRRFSYISLTKLNGELRDNTWVDTEAKLFEYFADLYEEKPFSSITMLSERGMCDSCKGVMEQFKELHPDVIVNMVSNKKVEGNVWGHRRKEKK